MKSLLNTDCLFPSSLEETLLLLNNPDERGTVLAGGSDLMAQWHADTSDIPERVISIFNLTELRGISHQNETVIIGAGTTHAEIHSSPLIQTHLPALAQAALSVGAVQIQSRGTIGGNIANASPAGDLAPSLLITDGRVVASSVNGERFIDLNNFFLDYRCVDLRPNELITRFELPFLSVGEKSIFKKLSPRSAQSISKIMGACLGSAVKGVISSFRVSLGSVAATAVRLRNIEEWITGKTISEDVLLEVEDMVFSSINPIADIRSSAEYRLQTASKMVRGFINYISE